MCFFQRYLVLFGAFFNGIFSLFVGAFVYSLRRRRMAEGKGDEAATDPRLEAISNYCFIIIIIIRSFTVQELEKEEVTR